MEILFELHLTTHDLREDEILDFERFCEKIEAKPILIELSKGTFYRQPMISKILKCNSENELKAKVKELKNEFLISGFEVIRTKIEVPFWHQKNATDFFKTESKTYFEWHGKVELSNEDLTRKIAGKFGGRLSRNVLKNDASTKFITLREYESGERITSNITELKGELIKNGIRLVKEELEFCIFDSNELLDKGWIF